MKRGENHDAEILSVMIRLIRGFLISFFPNSINLRELRVLRGEIERHFSAAAGATDVKRRPGFQTWSPRQPLPNSCDPWRLLITPAA
jgi:hypothetical protein